MTKSFKVPKLHWLTAKKKTLSYLEQTFTNAQIERMIDLACRRLKDNYMQDRPENMDDRKLWFELFYKNCAGYKYESWNHFKSMDNYNIYFGRRCRF